MRNPYIPHKTDKELRKYGYVPDADIRSMIREIEAVKVQLGWGERGLADHSVSGCAYPGQLERLLRLAWNDPDRAGWMPHARYWLETARAALERYKRQHGHLPSPHHPHPLPKLAPGDLSWARAVHEKVAANEARMAAEEIADNAHAAL